MSTNKPKIEAFGSRQAVISMKQVDSGETSIRAALSSDEPIELMPGISEVLVHTDEAIDLSRAVNGLPLTVGHSERDFVSQELPVGMIRNVRIEDGKTRGDLVFDSDDRSQAVRGKMVRGFAPNISVTYQRNSWDGPDEQGRITVDKWTPVAASIVSVPADNSVGVGRSLNQEATPMPDENNDRGTPSVIETIAKRASAGFQAGAEAERERLNAIEQQSRSLIAVLPALAPQLDELLTHARSDSSVSAADFQSLALELLGASNKPLSTGTSESAAPRFEMPGDNHRTIHAGNQDSRAQMHKGLELALSERVGVKVDAKAMEGNQYRGWSLLDMARESLESEGRSTRGLSSEQIAKQAIRSRAISPGTANYDTTDFPAVTENVVTKLARDGFAEQERVWDRVCSTNQVPDFKNFTVPRLSGISSLPVVAENAAYTNLTQADEKETATLVKRGGLFSLSWEAVVNDDTSMFSRTATRMGEAGQRTLDEGFFAFLAANALMGDGVALFAAGHSNTGTAAFDHAGVVAARTAMAKQTDDNSILLNIPMRLVLVPEELRDDADNLANSEYLPWTEASPGAQRVNTLRSTFEVVASARLSDANDWYGFARPGDTIECAFLNGNAEPQVERDMGWDTDAMHYKVRLPFVFYAVDWRGCYRNVVA